MSDRDWVRYSFAHVPLLRHVALDVAFRDGRLALRVQGRFAPLLRWAFTRFFDVYNHLGPVAAIGEARVYSLYVPPIPSPMHARHTEAFVRRWLLRERVPLAVTIGITDKCQCRCQHCSAVAAAPTGPLLSTDEVCRVVSESVALGASTITFTGGEPLLREDLEALVASVPREQAVALLFTNGIGLSSARARQLRAAGLWGVQISLDSPDPEEHDSRRGWRGSFEAVRHAVAAAREAGLLVGVSTYATEASVRTGALTRIAELGARWGAHELTAFDAIPTGRLRACSELLLSPASRRRLVREGLELRERYRGRMHVVTQAWTNGHRGFARFIGCLGGHYQFHITADGRFRPCDFTPLSFGNVRDTAVSELWRRLTTHPAYRRHSHSCRMQCPAFRRRYLDATS